MSRVREGARIEEEVKSKGVAKGNDGGAVSLAVHWVELLYLATRGGAEALGLPTGLFAPGVPFDAQQSKIPLVL